MTKNPRKSPLPRHPKGRLAYSRIVREALVVFAERGFATTSFREIADRAEMKQPAIFHYFEGKYELFEACVDEVLTHFQSILEGKIRVEHSAGERLQKNLLANLEWVDRHPSDTALLEFLYYTATHDPHFRSLYASLLGRVRHRYRELLHAGVREGIFKLSLDADSVAELLHEVVLGTLINYVSAERRTDERSVLLKKWTAALTALTGWRPTWE